MSIKNNLIPNLKKEKEKKISKEKILQRNKEIKEKEIK